MCVAIEFSKPKLEYYFYIKKWFNSCSKIANQMQFIPQHYEKVDLYIRAF